MFALHHSILLVISKSKRVYKMTLKFFVKNRNATFGLQMGSGGAWLELTVMSLPDSAQVRSGC